MREALAAMDEDDLRALQEAAVETGKSSSGLFSWLEHVATWELDRREGQKYVLRLPSERMEDDEAPAALAALARLAVLFRKHGTGPIDELLAAAAELVRGDDAVH